MPDRVRRVALLLGVVLLAACPRPGREGRPDDAWGQEETQDPRAAAEEVVGALAEEDFAALAGWVDREEGVLFAPYAYVEPGRHVTLSAEELREVARGETIERTWGAYDGTGEPIRVSFGSTSTASSTTGPTWRAGRSRSTGARATATRSTTPPRSGPRRGSSSTTYPATTRATAAWTGEASAWSSRTRTTAGA